MLNLALAVFSSAMVSIIMRAAAGDGRKPLLLVNYITCFIVSLAFVGGPFAGSGTGMALGMGLISGVLYLGSFMLLQLNVRRNGVTLAAAFMKLGVIVPTLLGFTLFQEPFRPLRLAGIALTVAAILTLNAGARKGDSGAGVIWLLPLLTLLGGFGDGTSKFYEAYGEAALEGWFLLFTFTFAGLLCAGVCVAQRQRVTRRDALFGVLLGIPNYFSSRFLLLALSGLPASVAFPCFSCGTILLIALAGRLLFDERLTKRQLIAMGLVLAALVLLNV